MLKRICLPLLVLALLAPASASAELQTAGQYGVGTPVPGNGGVVTPFGVAVSPDGTVLTADISVSRVEVFGQDGRFLRAIGSDVSYSGGTGPEVCVTDCRAGTPTTEAGGELITPYGIAAGADEFYVSETGVARVAAFSYDGKFIRAIGKDVGGPGVNVCTTSCTKGTMSAEAGSLAAPGGLALDSSGNLYATDLGLKRVNVVDPKTGQFIRAFGKDVGGPGVNVCTNACGVGTDDGSPGSIGSSFGVAAAAGEIFVSETTNSRISVFGEDGIFRRAIGSAGSAAGQLAGPYGVAVDPAAGNVFVSDTGNNRLTTFGVGGEFRNARGLDVIPGEPLGTEVCTTSCQAGKPEFSVGAFISPFGAAVDCRGAVYVGMVGRVEKYADPAVRKPPCPSNAFTIGKVKKNKKKGTATVTVTLPGPGTLAAALGKKLSAKVPQPQAAGDVKVTVKAAGKGVKALRKKGKLKGNLKLTFTPPNGDPATQSKKLTLAKKLKKSKKAKKSGR